jgi:hypothetical protein
MVTHAAKVDKNATPRDYIKTGYMMIAILAIGLVVGGAIQLHMGYHHGTTLGGSRTPVNQWAGNLMNTTHNTLIRWTNGSWHPATPQRIGNLATGTILAGGLYIACMMMPRWPLHPIGMVIMGHYYGHLAWASLMFGWLIKVMIIKYGGAYAFRRAQPLFLGIILGEIFSAVIWTLIPIILILMGAEPSEVGRISILPT